MADRGLSAQHSAHATLRAATVRYAVRMLPELGVLAGRAAAAREQLEALIAVVPGDYWDRREAGDAWTARTHLQHLATIDAPTRALFAAATAGSALGPFGADSAATFEAARAALLDSVANLPVPTLVERMRAERAAALGALAVLGARELDVPVVLPGVVDAWRRPVSVPLRQYAAAWAVHDAGHAAAIRRAIACPPSPGDLALAARLRREPARGPTPQPSPGR